MPRRRVLTDEQLTELLALPVTESLLIQHWTLSPADLAIVERRRGDPNQLGFALQLCAFRYPGRLLWSDEAIPAPALALRPGENSSARCARRSALPCSLRSTSASY